jgi:hypothetical protein
MNHGCFVLFLLGGLATNQLTAQTTCDGQIVPLKPVSAACANAAPICVTGRNQVIGHWVWGCPGQPQPDSGAWKIPLMIQQPHIMTPAEAAEQAERLRSFRLQNQQIEQQLKDGQTVQESAPDPTAPDAEKLGFVLGELVTAAIKQGHKLECTNEPMDSDHVKLHCTIVIDLK